MEPKSYWNICGQNEFPTLFLCAKSLNEMICSWAVSERVWWIYCFIQSRLRNRFTNDKVETLVFIYVKCAILDKDDHTDDIMDEGEFLSGIDYEGNEEN